ncbi:MAG: hypothetical protein KatS3mg024_1544 [Armatimonadota bacterium]|nr:MAG: hypothetical protein KatS3mg024_1544 [Armatimonadota bacterium]
MSLEGSPNEGRLKPRRTSRREIADLMSVASTSLGDAQADQLSLDGRFNCA